MTVLYRLYDALTPYRKMIQIALIIFVAGFAVSVLMRSAMKKPHRGDVPVFVRAAQAVEEGTDIYDAKTERQWNYVYLPLLAILLRPFVKWPFPVIVIGWYFLSMAALAGSVLLAVRLSDDRKLAWRPAVIALALASPTLLNTVSRGQLGTLSLFFSMACFMLYKERKDFTAGFVLGFAIVLKVSPLLFLALFFILRRSWRVLFGMAVSGFLFAFLFPAAVVGWAKNLYFLKTWLHAMHLGTSSLAQTSQLWAQLLDPYASDNQSLYAVMMRLWGPAADQLKPGGDAGIRLAARGLGVVLLAALAGVTARQKRNGIDRGVFLEYALFPMAMLFLSPVSEAHHYTVIYLPMLAALWMLEDRSRSPRQRWLLEAGLGVAVLAVLFGLIFNSLNATGAYVWGGLALWLALLGLRAFQLKRTGRVSNRVGGEVLNEC